MTEVYVKLTNLYVITTKVATISGTYVIPISRVKCLLANFQPT